MIKPIDSLKLSNVEWSQLVLTLDKQVREPVNNIRKGGQRVGMSDNSIALLRPYHDEQLGEHIRVRCRNISRSGVGLMHGRFIHPGTRVQMIFITTNREGLIMEGAVVRARLIDKHIHEIGIQFEEHLTDEEAAAIDLELPVEPTEEEEPTESAPESENSAAPTAETSDAAADAPSNSDGHESPANTDGTDASTANAA